MLLRWFGLVVGPGEVWLRLRAVSVVSHSLLIELWSAWSACVMHVAPSVSGLMEGGIFVPVADFRAVGDERHGASDPGVKWWDGLLNEAVNICVHASLADVPPGAPPLGEGRSGLPVLLSLMLSLMMRLLSMLSLSLMEHILLMSLWLRLLSWSHSHLLSPEAILVVVESLGEAVVLLRSLLTHFKSLGRRGKEKGQYEGGSLLHVNKIGRAHV